MKSALKHKLLEEKFKGDDSFMRKTDWFFAYRVNGELYVVFDGITVSVKQEEELFLKVSEFYHDTLDRVETYKLARELIKNKYSA